MSGFYYDEFKEWADGFHKRVSSNSADAIIIYLLENAGEWVIGEVKEKTPVGQYPPYKHVAFETSYGKVVNFMARDGRTGGTLRRNWKKTRVTKSGSGYSITIYNNIYYAEWVEKGHNKRNRHGATVGWQPGVFMLELTLQEFQQKIVPILGKTYRQLLIDFLGW